MKPSFLNQPRPIVTGMVLKATPDEACYCIKNSIYDGADALGIQLCRLRREYKTKEHYRNIFAAVGQRPIYITNYRSCENTGMTDEECMDGLVTALGCGATMKELQRTKSGDFLLENAHTIEELEKMEMSERISLLVPPENLFLEAPCVRFSEFYTKLFKSGCEIYQKKIGTSYEVGTPIRVYEGDEFLALAEVKEYEGGSAIKSKKFFKI